jgi:hypothetical protein
MMATVLVVYMSILECMRRDKKINPKKNKLRTYNTNP